MSTIISHGHSFDALQQGGDDSIGALLAALGTANDPSTVGDSKSAPTVYVGEASTSKVRLSPIPVYFYYMVRWASVIALFRYIQKHIIANLGIPSYKYWYA